MSRYKSALVLIVILLFTACSQKSPRVQIGKKAFANEDILIIKALDDQRSGRYKNAMETLDTLYKKSGKVNYLEEKMKVAMISKYPKVLALLNNSIKKYPKNVLFKKLLIQYFITTKKYKKAEFIALRLLKIKRNVQNLSILGDIYMLEKSYKLALKYYQSSFKVNDSEKYLLKMIDIMYSFLDKKQESIAYLETYIRLHDADKKAYFTLIQIYGREKNIDGLTSTYKKLYMKYKKQEYAKKTISLLMYKKDKQGAIKFLKKSGYKPKMLLDFYASNQNYKEAFKVAKKLYNETKDVLYLGKMAIFEYEGNRTKLNKKILDSVSKKFESVLKDYQDPLYLNYYGYLLIDHDINVKKGIKLVKRALEIEPKSLFYLDSLAWGYYKLNKCKKAYNIMKRFAKSTNEPEVNMHFKMIKKCLKESK
jgi:predicted Zn-dependent protease